MTDAERREAARQFYYKWVGRGKEDEDDRSFWIDFLQNVMGINQATDRIEFQKKVANEKGSLSNRIDAYIPETHVLIEQKSLGIDLSKPQPGHDNKTPYEQAKDYDNALPVSEKAKWIVVSNFAEIWVYDMDTRVPEPTKYLLSDIPTKYSLFEFLINKEEQKISKEMEVSVKAGEFVGLIYDALLEQYINPESEESLKSLNMLCVRLVFCLYAEDAHIFGNNGHMFHDYMAQFETKDMRRALIDLFKILDTPENERDPYDDSNLAKFPYVNGGLFADENIEIPKFTEEIRDILLAKASEGFDWSMISPTIFGAVFESTLNPETRHAGGMHYTSIENIHKVIDPLFLDDLIKEFEAIDSIQVLKTKEQKLKAFQDKLANLRWLDPACGSGNFLTETYISIRRLENRVISSILNCEKGAIDGQIAMGGSIVPIKVEISQFYGIEINDFAVTVAKTALWIAESQMLKETEDILLIHLDFLPLKTNACIVEANALRVEWNDIVPREELNYIMGNPPFLGASNMSPLQKEEAVSVFGKIKLSNSIDYVGAWYHLAAAYIQNTHIKAAFVSTNSITQGEQVKPLWDKVLNKYGSKIIFAVRTFVWDSEASEKAHVHCVIIGFSFGGKVEKKYIYDGLNKKEVKTISPYLIEADNILIESIANPLCDVPKMYLGNKPSDGGNLILSENEKEEILQREPTLERFIHEYTGAVEYINNKKRYCLWLKDATPYDLKESPELYKRIMAVKKMRESSSAKPTREKAATPHLFFYISQPETNYLLIPSTSSQNRRYIPIGFMDPSVIASNSTTILPNASRYHFGILESNVHMSWMRTVAGRLKSDYRYSNGIVYNTFPWPIATEQQKEMIEKTAQGILDARAMYPDCSLADLYDPLTMPVALQKAHIANDKAVMQAYGFDVKDTSEADCVEALMKMYQVLVNKRDKEE